MSGTAAGVPLNIVLTIVSASTCAPLAGRAVYLWHCDREGRYSLYTQGVTNQNYLRGVQESEREWPGHVPVDLSRLLRGTLAAHPLRGVSQACRRRPARTTRPRRHRSRCRKTANDLVYATSGYEHSIRNAAQVTLASDNVFSDGSALELATTTGDVTSGFTATLTVAI